MILHRKIMIVNVFSVLGVSYLTKGGRLANPAQKGRTRPSDRAGCDMLRSLKAKMQEFIAPKHVNPPQKEAQFQSSLL